MRDFTQKGCNTIASRRICVLQQPGRGDGGLPPLQSFLIGVPCMKHPTVDHISNRHRHACIEQAAAEIPLPSHFSSSLSFRSPDTGQLAARQSKAGSVRRDLTRTPGAEDVKPPNTKPPNLPAAGETRGLCVSGSTRSSSGSHYRRSGTSPCMRYPFPPVPGDEGPLISKVGIAILGILHVIIFGTELFGRQLCSRPGSAWFR